MNSSMRVYPNRSSPSMVHSSFISHKNPKDSLEVFPYVLHFFRRRIPNNKTTTRVFRSSNKFHRWNRLFESSRDKEQHIQLVSEQENFSFSYENLKAIDPVAANRIHPNDNRKTTIPLLPVFSSMKLLMRYSLGSVAIGTLIVNFVESTRFILEAIRRRLKVADIMPESWIKRMMLHASRLCLKFIELIIKSVNRNAYIMDFRSRYSIGKPYNGSFWCEFNRTSFSC